MSKPPRKDSPDTPDEETAYQETMALTKEEMGIREKEDEKEDREKAPHQETLAISRKEMGITDDGASEKHQKTQALTREEMGIADRPSGTEEENGYQRTVAMTREEMGIAGESGGYQETMAMSREEMGIREPGEEGGEGYQETMVLTKAEMGIPGGRPGDKEENGEYQQTQPLHEEGTVEGVGGPRDREADFSATRLEKEYHRKWIERDHGDDKYGSEGKIVAGGMGAILRVLDRNLQRISAMKVILPDYKNKADALTGFITEAKITGLLEHPNIIPVHDLGFSEASGIYFTMKLAQGEALYDILEKLRKSDPEYLEKYHTYQLLNIFRKVCDAVSFAHAKGILHQDIKPHNIMVGPHGEVLLMDWGLARYLGGEEGEIPPEEAERIEEIFAAARQAEAESEDLIKGSPTFMSPEQVKGEPLDRRSDIFLLGATLYHIFTLSPPYGGATLMEVLEKALVGNYIPPAEKNPARQIPPDICRIITRAMAPAKEDRYQAVEEMSGEIDDLIAGRWSRQERKRFSQGDWIMREGDAGDEAYLILSGEVQVLKDTDGERIPLGTLRSGDIFGEMSLITPVTRSASVRAETDTEVAVLTRELVSQNLQKLPPYMEKIVSTLTDRLRAANVNIHPYAATDCTLVVLKQLRLLAREKSCDRLTEFSIPPYEIAAEIARDLGLPLQRVQSVLSEAEKEGLVAMADGRLSVPDPSKLGA